MTDGDIPQICSRYNLRKGPKTPKSNKMIGIIWNCRGVSKKGMSTFLKELMFDYHADFIGLQETIKRKYIDKFFREVDPGKAFSWHWLPANGRSGGMLCGVKNERLEVINFETGSFSIVANVMDKKLQKKTSVGHCIWASTR
jgi:hypothetical protein